MKKLITFTFLSLITLLGFFNFHHHVISLPVRHPASVEQSLKLAFEDDSQKLKFLMAIHEQIPELFSDSARFDIDLFNLLDDQAKLQELLNENPKYVELWEKRQYLDFTFEVKSINTKALVTEQVSSEIFLNWKEKLALAVNAHAKDDISILEKELLSLESSWGKPASQAILNGLIVNLKSEDQKFARKLQMKGTPDEIQEFLIKNLPDYLTQFKANGKTGANRDEVISLWKKAKNVEEKIGPLMDLYILLQSRKESIQSFSKSLASLDREDLENLASPEYQTRAFRELYNGKEETPLFYQKHLKSLALSSEKVIDDVGGLKIRIAEQNPHVAIFRGCTGGDCASQYSFPYPNDPHERVFFIYDEKSALKGYVSATIVETENHQKALYIITISGNRVNAADTDLIIQGLNHQKKSFGVSQIILPTEENIRSMINFHPVRDIYNQAVAGKKAVPIEYQDYELRKVIEEFESENNSGGYDHADKNKMGIVYSPPKERTLDLNVTEHRLNFAERIVTPKTTFNPVAVLEFAQALNISHRTELLDKAIEIGFLSKEQKSAAKKFMKFLDTRGSYASQFTIAEIEKEASYFFDLIGLEANRAKEKKTQWLLNAYLGSKDAFDGGHLKFNLELIAWDLKLNDPPLMSENNRNKWIETFSKSVEYKKFQQNYLTKILEHPQLANDLMEKDMKMLAALYKDPPEDLMKKIVHSPVIFEQIMEKDIHLYISSPNVQKYFLAGLYSDNLDVKLKTLAFIDRKMHDRETLLKLLELVKTPQDSAFQQKLFETFFSIKSDDKEVNLAILKMMADSHYLHIAPDSFNLLLTSMKSYDPEVLNALVNILKIKKFDSVIVEGVFRYLENAPNLIQQNDIINSPTVEKFFLSGLYSENLDVKLKALDFIKKKKHDKETLLKLLELVKVPQDSKFQQKLFETLSLIKSDEKEVNLAIIKMMTDSHYTHITPYSFFLLVTSMKSYDPEVLNALVNTLKIKKFDSVIVEGIFRYLENAPNFGESVNEALISLAMDKTSTYRVKSLKLIKKMPYNDHVEKAVVAALNDNIPEVRDEFLTMLSKSTSKNLETRDVLIHMAKYGEAPLTRKYALESLGKLKWPDEEIIKIIKNSSNDSDSKIREASNTAYKNLAPFITDMAGALDCNKVMKNFIKK